MSILYCNVSDLYEHHLKFLMAGRISLKRVKQEIDHVRSTLCTYTNYSSTYDLYATTQQLTWSYEKERPCHRDPVIKEHRMYLHLYWNGEKALEVEKSFHLLLGTLQEEMESDKRHTPGS